MAGNAIDGSASTRWSTSGAQTGQFFRVDMLSPQIFSEVTLDAGTTTTNFPRGYQLNVSNDGTTWTAVTTRTGTTALVTITFANADRPVRRINQTATNGTMWSIQEMNVFGLALSRTGWVAVTASCDGQHQRRGERAGWQCDDALEQFGRPDRPIISSRYAVGPDLQPADARRGHDDDQFSARISSVRLQRWDELGGGDRDGHQGDGILFQITFPTQWARFIKINQTATNSTVWSIQELNVAGQPAVQIAQPRTGWVPTGSSTSGTNVAANALDGSTTTRWSTSGAQTGQSFKVDMLKPAGPSSRSCWMRGRRRTIFHARISCRHRTTARHSRR